MSKKSMNEEGAGAVGGNLGKTVQRLRKAYNMSLSELSEQSGVAKSIISAIEKNETNPTLSTIWRLSQALDTTIDKVLGEDESAPLIEKVEKAGIPNLFSEDGKCRLAIIGPLESVNYVQWYDFHAEPGGVLESEGHRTGSIEHLSVLAGELEVEVGGEKRRAKAGETLRYQCDGEHIVRNIGSDPAHATMVMILQPAMMR